MKINFSIFKIGESLVPLGSVKEVAAEKLNHLFDFLADPYEKSIIKFDFSEIVKNGYVLNFKNKNVLAA